MRRYRNLLPVAGIKCHAFKHDVIARRYAEMLAATAARQMAFSGRVHRYEI